MGYPWIGRREPLPADAMTRAAAAIGCDVGAIMAVWQVEAAGRYHDATGSVLSRFEPHHAPGFDGWTWRDSLKISTAHRWDLFLRTYKHDPEGALRASSWGAPQIMGFNHVAAGYFSTVAMVEDMAEREEAHLMSFVRLVIAWGLDSALRAHDWYTFAKRYNGSGQPGVYAARMERAYRAGPGAPRSAVVLRVGSRGASVKELQRALGIPDDGAFGPQTLAAVKAFQKAQGLAVDGIVGAKTWAALKARSDVSPRSQSANVALAHITTALKGLKR